MGLGMLKSLLLPSFSATGEEGGGGGGGTGSGSTSMTSPQNRSMLKDFIASIATMTGDLSNITAPPFVLDPKSVVEIPAFWAENPTIFCSPATSEDPAERALLVLRSFISGMKSQCYMGHTEEEGVKKPLNSFLGEIFLGKWEDDVNGTTYLVSEQVSHHPPVTACRVWNEKFGVVAEGYNRQKITFSGNVNIQAVGHALKSLETYDEHYLIPLPDFKVKGVLSGAPYPETSGTYYIPSTSGYMSVVHFTGKGLLDFRSSKKHEFTAHVYKEEDGEDKPLYTLSGSWNSEFTIRDDRKGEIIETFDVASSTAHLPPLILEPLEDQDPWESRRAWNDTATAIRNGNMRGTSEAKSQLEQGQRDMRKDEERDGKTWSTLYFKPQQNHDIIEQLTKKVPGAEAFEKTRDTSEGVWRFDVEAYKNAKKPYRGDLRPDNTRTSEQESQHVQSQSQSNALPQTEGQTKNDPAARQDNEIDEKVGAVEDGRPVEVNGTKTDVGILPTKKEIQGITKDQPTPQAAQKQTKAEELGSGVEGLSIRDKDAVEDMLRDQYSHRALRS